MIPTEGTITSHNKYIMCHHLLRLGAPFSEEGSLISNPANRAGGEGDCIDQSRLQRRSSINIISTNKSIYYFSFVLIQKKQKIKARDATLVSPFPQLLSRCFVGDFSTTSKKTRLSSSWKPEHPSAGKSLNVFGLCHPKFPTKSQ